MSGLLLSLLFFLTSCTPAAPTPPAPQEWKINSISLKAFPSAKITIDNDAHSVAILLPYGTALGKSAIDISLASGLTSTPKSGDTVDLTSFSAIYLADKDGNAMKYSVQVKVKGAPYTTFISLKETKYRVTRGYDDSRITFTFPYGADLKHLSFSAKAQTDISFSPDIADLDLTTPKEVTIIAEDGETTKNITLEAALYPKDTGVRGVYLPSPAHTGSFLSYNEVKRSIDLLAELNFNCLFVCAWAASKTAWDSDVLMSNSTWADKKAGNMYASYTGGSGDALKDIIEVAHAKGIKVILWFEYGFMHAVGGVNWNDPVLKKHPDWLGIREDGAPCNYNDTDFYLNGYSSDVQQFMMDLMKEAVMRYPEVDGVQGDDRLPAMPRNAGYDSETKAAYLAETGKTAPSDYNDKDWSRWRLDRLNAFAKRMHTELKGLRSSLIVCFAPNKYPWCESVLMQDWPGWLADGSADLLTVQCYVTATYNEDVYDTMTYVKEKTSADIFNPAMILKNGDNVMKADMLAEELQYNREIGTFGESQFWFDGLKEKEIQDVFKAYYSYPVEFPAL